jgi:galactose mutarotase-like enzyme
MPQHGFARDNNFTVLEATSHTARLQLNNNPATEAMFPFPFSLETGWSLEGPSLNLTFTLSNTGHGPMPVSIGWHPAFRWDASPGWQLLFDEEETHGIRRVDGQVQLTAAAYPTPVQNRVLTLTEDLFAQGAIIFEAVKSRTVRYVSPEGPLLDLALAGFTQFTIWKQTGTNFVCLEPWAGLPAPSSYRGEALKRPGQMLLQPGARAEFSCRVTLHQ